MSKYHITRIMQVLQSTTVKAGTSDEAIKLSKKLKQKDWAVVDNKRRKNYKAEKVNYPC